MEAGSHPGIINIPKVLQPVLSRSLFHKHYLYITLANPGYCVAEADSGGSGESPDQVEQLILLAPEVGGEDVQLGHGDVPGVEAEVQHSGDSLPASQEPALPAL